MKNGLVLVAILVLGVVGCACAQMRRMTKEDSLAEAQRDAKWNQAVESGDLATMRRMLYGVSLSYSKYVLKAKGLAFRLHWANNNMPGSVESWDPTGFVVLCSVHDRGESVCTGDTIDLYIGTSMNTKTIVLKTGEKMRISPDGELTPVVVRKPTRVATPNLQLDLEEVLATYMASGYSTTEIYPLLKGKLFHLTTIRVQCLRIKNTGLYSLSLPGGNRTVYLDFGTTVDEAPWMIRGATCKCVGTYSFINALGLTSKVLNLKVIDPGEIDTDDGGWGR